MLDVNKFEKPLGKWFQKLKPFFESEEGEELYSYLKSRGLKGHRILPTSDRTFRAFELTDPKNIKAIFIGLAPYHNYSSTGIPCADGLAFSNGLTYQESPSLKLFYNAMENDLGEKIKYRSPDLSYLAQQGVLLLNYSLTCEAGKATIHADKGVWNDFNKFFYGTVLAAECGIPIVLVGKEAWKLEKLLFNMCHVIKKIEHMAYAARQEREWNCEKIFTWCNKIIKENNGEDAQIKWAAENEFVVMSVESDMDLPF